MSTTLRTAADRPASLPRTLSVPGNSELRRALARDIAPGERIIGSKRLADGHSLTLEATDRGACALRLEASDHSVPRALEPLFAAIEAHLAAPRDCALELPIEVAGTPFQLAVWTELLAIPTGSVTTYGAIAASLGRPTAARAVGTAVGSNRIAIAIPCHRVIAADGTLNGFAWGLDWKRRLLDGEGALA